MAFVCACIKMTICDATPLMDEYNLLCYFPKQNYVTDIMLCNASTQTHSTAWIHAHPYISTCVHCTHTLFCFRAPFSFMWGQSLPVITALISATGTAERTTTTRASLWQLSYPRWVAASLKLEIFPGYCTHIWGNTGWLLKPIIHQAMTIFTTKDFLRHLRLSCKESWGTSPWGLSSRSP